MRWNEYEYVLRYEIYCGLMNVYAEEIMIMMVIWSESVFWS